MIAPSYRHSKLIAAMTGIVFSSSNNIERTKPFIVLSTYYVLFSTVEWFIHKYIMHAGVGIFNQVHRDHIRHHKNVKEDMKLYEKIEDDDESGEFNWGHTLLISISTHLITYKYMKTYFGISSHSNAAIVCSSGFF